MWTEWTFPVSSSMRHVMVPVMTLDTVLPPKPVTTLLHGRRELPKSSFLCEMVPEQRLSIPTRPLSVSKTFAIRREGESTIPCLAWATTIMAKMVCERTRLRRGGRK